MLNVKFYFSTLIILLLSYSCLGQLSRRGQWDATLQMNLNSKGVIIKDITKDGAADRAGLREGDVITKINDDPIGSKINFDKINRSLRANVNTTLLVKRNQKALKLAIRLTPVPFEKVEGLDIEYGSILTNDGYNVRTIVSKPKGTEGKLPGILFIQWLSCSNVEGRGDSHGFSNLLWSLSKAGYVVLRTERPGVGDSEGPDCSELDFESDLSFQRNSLEYLKSLESVDSEKIIVFGGSMGGAMAPLLVSEWDDESIIGIISNGGYTKSWYEHMLENRRRIMTFQNKSPGEIHLSMNRISELYVKYLINGYSPREIFKEKPYLMQEWTGSDVHQFGRPASFYQQANSYNIAGEWENISIPTLSVYNEFDWVMSKEDHMMIVEIVNKKNPGKATYMEIGQTDHNWYYYEDERSQKEAFQNRSRTPNSEGHKLIIKWLDDIIKSP